MQNKFNNTSFSGFFSNIETILENDYKRHSVASLETVFNLINQNPLPKTIKINGLNLRLGQTCRRKLFTFHDNLKCVSCDLEGKFFSIEYNNHANVYSINLYAKEYDKEILMNSDHIDPKGADHMGNRQTMCVYCNRIKGMCDFNDYLESVSEIKYLYPNINRLDFYKFVYIHLYMSLPFIIKNLEFHEDLNEYPTLSDDFYDHIPENIKTIFDNYLDKIYDEYDDLMDLYNDILDIRHGHPEYSEREIAISCRDRTGCFINGIINNRSQEWFVDKITRNMKKSLKNKNIIFKSV